MKFDPIDPAAPILDQSVASDCGALAVGCSDAAGRIKRATDQMERQIGELGQLEEYVVGRTKLAEDKIAQAESQAIQEVRALSADVAISAAERLLSSKVKGAAGDALVAKSISDVKTRLN